MSAVVCMFKVTGPLQFLYIYMLASCTSLSDHDRKISHCPLWHVLRNEECECGASFDGTVSCDENFVYIKYGNCMTWNNSTTSAELHSCLLTRQDIDHECARDFIYHIPINISANKLDHLTCDRYNRQGTQCRQCKQGYGPAVFFDGVSCACLLYTSPSPRDATLSRMPSSA